MTETEQNRRTPPSSPDRGQRIGVNMPTSLLAQVDAWIANQKDCPSRPKAIKQLVEQSLNRQAHIRGEWIRAIIIWANDTSQVERVWIFGSRIKGSARAESDLDIAVEVITNEHPEMVPSASETRTSSANMKNWECQIARLIDVPVQVSIKNMSPTLSPDIDGEGMLIYSRADHGRRDAD